MRWRAWPGWAVALGLYAVAAAARLALAGTHPYGDEAHHYYIARHLGHAPDNLFAVGDLRWLFWWRPMFSLLLAPGAQLGFTGFRVGYALLAALLAPALFAWLRGRGVGQVASVAAALVAAFHPFLLVWGVRAFPDGLMAALFVAGLALWERNWRATGALVLLLATWTKESALIGVAVLLADELAADLRRGGRWGVLLRPGLRHALLAGVLALAYLPHLYAESIGGRAPGWSRGGSAMGVLDGAFTTLWFVPLVAAGLAFRPSRRPALLALAYLGFYLAYTVVLGGFAEGWYFFLPSVLALAAVTALVSALARDQRSRLRHAGRAVAAVAATVLLAQVLLPADTAHKQAVLHPESGTVELSYQETLELERTRDADLWRTLDQLRGEDLRNVLLVDVAWFFAIWPFSDRAGFVATAYTEGSVPDQVWGDAIEDIANATVVRRGTTPLSLALGDVYGDCITDASPEYVILRGQGCKGRLEQLRAAFVARGGTL